MATYIFDKFRPVRHRDSILGGLRMPGRPSSLRPHRVALGVSWLVLVVIMIGTIISSVGGVSSHGIAVVASGFHGADASADASHAHAYEAEDSGPATMHPGATADHPHHSVDHSHDKAHALPTAWSSAGPQLPGWFELVRPWIEMVQASRFERPPMR